MNRARTIVAIVVVAVGALGAGVAASLGGGDGGLDIVSGQQAGEAPACEFTWSEIRMSVATGTLGLSTSLLPAGERGCRVDTTATIEVTDEDGNLADIEGNGSTEAVEGTVTPDTPRPEETPNGYRGPVLPTALWLWGARCNGEPLTVTIDVDDKSVSTTLPVSPCMDGPAGPLFATPDQ